ncbi:extracellular solute-binding protein [Enterococcus sp. BWB1-3]|uniref:ABC transporter substrate-binding protein n=1 Tax=unclassified Enterococcus TaxID=2608891 RepID=UPI001922AE6F|nr:MULTISPECIES: extracellular solute-binding protein [unclassified Enterococcus]MBL1230203.1 extracellular solute-binding protein [Enterococcus sp. BWB1-3]MCB5953203.1 extracellular solute-binding protein [Enterococcus sp. BWT-B8]
MKMKLFGRTLVSGIALTMLLSGCSGSSSAGSKVEGAGVLTDEEVTIKFAWWGADIRHEAMKKVVELYEEEHPNVTVEVEYGAWEGWQAKTLTQLSGKTEADVMQVNYNWLFSYGKGKNVFYDLNEVKDYLDLSNWDKKYLEAMQVNGEQAAVPHGMTGRVPMYNEQLYKDNGLELPQTYEDLIKAGEVIGKDNTATGEDNKYAFVNMGKVSKDLFIAQMLFNKTGEVMQTDGKVNYSEADVKEVLEQYQAFEDANAFPTFAQDGSIDTNANPEWVEGQAGGVYEWANSLAQWAESYKGGEAKDELLVGDYLLPAADQNVSIYVKPNFGYAVSRNSKNPEVAADFINFLLTDEEAVKETGDTLGISSNKITNELQVKNNLLEGVVKDGYEKLDQYEQTVMDPYFEDENVRNERYTVIEAFRTGKLTAGEAAKQYISKQQDALDKHYQK